MNIFIQAYLAIAAVCFGGTAIAVITAALFVAWFHRVWRRASAQVDAALETPLEETLVGEPFLKCARAGCGNTGSDFLFYCSDDCATACTPGCWCGYRQLVAQPDPAEPDTHGCLGPDCTKDTGSAALLYCGYECQVRAAERATERALAAFPVQSLYRVPDDAPQQPASAELARRFS